MLTWPESSTAGPRAALVEQADGRAVAVGAEGIDTEFLVVGKSREAVSVVGVGDEEVDVRVGPRGGVDPGDRARAQVEVLFERGPGGRPESSRYPRIATRGPIGRSSPGVGQSSMPTYIHPRSVSMNLGASAGLSSTRQRHYCITGRWLPSASTRA